MFEEGDGFGGFGGGERGIGEGGMWRWLRGGEMRAGADREIELVGGVEIDGMSCGKGGT